MPLQKTTIQEETHYKIMRVLEENPDLTQRELAEQLGVSLGRLNYCLKALKENGWVKMKNFIYSKNKFGYVYMLTPAGIAKRVELTSAFLVRKSEEYEMLKNEIEILKKDLKKL
jgi:EPS-associated MarR family transcriptional regulator